MIFFNNIKRVCYAVIVCALLFPIACNGGQMAEETIANKYVKLSNVPETIWRKVSSKTIFFGHQSVGYNILEGVRDIEAANPSIKLGIQETFDPAEFKASMISHYQIGYNENPRSKLDMFSFIARSGGAEKADIMFFKFCYIDFNSETDVDSLFESYRNTYAALKKKYPNTIFMHCTVPLTVIQSGPKTFIKKLMGRAIGGIAENAKRHQFNELVRKNYEGKDFVFDIAAAESTFPDGKRATYEYNGIINYCLVPDYTNDGEHLNEHGRKIVAAKLLLLLASISS